MDQIHFKKHINKIRYASADFETTSNEETPEVYSWGMVNPYETKNYRNEKYNYVVKGQIIYGISIEGFLHYIKSIKYSLYIYFHNGSKFDLQFILPKLYENGFNQQPFTFNNSVLLNLSTNDFVEDNTAEGFIQLKRKEYKLIIDGPKVMEIKIGTTLKYREKGRAKRNIVSIRDSLLLFQGSIKLWGELVGIPKLEKKDGYNRLWFYKTVEELEKDGDEINYLLNDVIILHKYLELMNKEFSINEWKLTSASTSYKQWLNIYGTELINKKIETGKVQEVIINEDTGFKKYRYNNRRTLMKTFSLSNELIKKEFPTKWLDEFTKEDLPISKVLNRWYSGGITYLNPMWKGIRLNNVWSADINSSYPSVMNSDLFYPYGKGVKGNRKEYPLKLYKVKTFFPIKNKNGLPFVPTLKTTATGEAIRKEYFKTLPVGTYLMTDIELQRFKKYYSYRGKCKFNIEWSFKAKKGTEIFKGYVDKYYKQKSIAKFEKDIAKTATSKLFLNSLYGKFGTKTTRENIYYDPKNKVFEKEKVLTKSNFYLPLAIYITAYARMKIIDAVGTNINYFCYCDTDSIFFNGNGIEKFKKNINFDNEILGDWDIELKEGEGIFRRPKQYLFFEKDNIKSAFAGINFSRTDFLKKDDVLTSFIIGDFVPNQTQGRKKQTGIFIEEIDKEIKPIWSKSYISKEDWFKSEETYIENYEKYFNKIKKYLL